ESREKEVVDIMMTLFNKEQVLEAYVEEERQAARSEGKMEGKIEGKIEGKMQQKKETVFNLYNMGMKEDFIAKATNISIDLVRQWLGLAIS
ncbi:MAG: hypothetical protein ACI4F9_06745, partial [Lachnospiraceae bacterium]